MTKFLFLLTVPALLAIPAPVWPGPVSNSGSEFWLTFPAQYQLTPQTFSLFILSQTNASGQVSIPGLSFTAPFLVGPNAAVTVTVPTAAMLTTQDGVQDLGIHVLADHDITVYGLEYEQYTTDGYLALPVGAIGTDYWVVNYSANVTVSASATTAIASSEFAVVACLDSTSVTITPPITVGGRVAGVPYTVNLNRGEAYQLQAPVLSADLTGTRVSANFGVALFGAVGCADVPTGVFTCNTLLEQEPPLATWGTTFITVPLAGRSQDTFRCLASSDGTVVSVNGVAAVTLNQGQFVEQAAGLPVQVTSNFPVLLTQYSESRLSDGVTMGDPSQIIVPPADDYGTQSQFFSPASGFALNYVNVAAANSAVGSILLDGVAIPSAIFTAVGASGYSSAQVTVGTGYHQLSGPASFAAESYGFDVRDAYGYPAGMVFRGLPTLTPTPSPTPTLSPTPVPTDTPTCVVKAWPVPFNPGYAVRGTFKVDCLQTGDQVSFYTLSGEKVSEGTASGGQYEWNGSNEKGIPVASGVYFYAVVRNGSVVKRDKFILTR